MIVHRPLGFQDAVDSSQMAGVSQEVKVEEPSQLEETDEKEVTSTVNADETKNILVILTF